MSDLKALNSAVQQYYIDNREWPANLETYTTLTEICNAGTEQEGHSIDCAVDGLIDLSMLVPTYISTIPTDPQVTASLPFTNTAHAQTTNGTGYEIALDSTTQMVMLTAPNSVEYDLTPVQLGTTALTDVDYSCGVEEDPDCWSTTAYPHPTAVPTRGYLWSDDTSEFKGIDSTTDGAGNIAALAALGSNYEAATYCAELTEGGYPPGTWYLPAIDQIEAALIEYKAQYSSDPNWGGFEVSTDYWSSTEESSTAAWDASYGGGNVGTINDVKTAMYMRVRCLR